MTETPRPTVAAQFSPNVVLEQVDGRSIYLIGTAHLSRQSAQEAEDVIRRVRPHSVCVELCESRHAALSRPEAWREMDLFQVVRKKQATTVLAHLILSAFQRRMGEHLGVRPGLEMIRAMETAEAVGAELVLADRNIQVTLIRTWRNLRWWDKLRVTFGLMFTLVAAPRFSEAEIEALKEEDMLGKVMGTFATEFPRAKETLIDERDRFLAHKIRTAPGQTVVAVLGAGHLQGVRALLAAAEEDFDEAALLSLPRLGPVRRLLPWAVPALVLGLIGYGFFAADAEVSWEMAKIWVLANGVLAAVGAALALAHPLTVAAAFVAAPFTSLNPMVAAGWVAGLCELALRRPRVRDFENLPNDLLSLRGFWRNGITRVLLVVALANLGSTVGTLIGLPLMGALLG